MFFLITILAVISSAFASSVGEGVSNNPTPFGVNGLYNIIAADTMGRTRLGFAFWGTYGTMKNFTFAKFNNSFEKQPVKDMIIDATVNSTICYSILDYLETSMHNVWYIDKYDLEDLVDRYDVQPPTNNGVGDLDWYLKCGYPGRHDPIWNVALQTKLTIPTGKNTDPYRLRPRTEDKVMFGVSALFTLDLIKEAPDAPFRFHANVGYQMHNKEVYPSAHQLPFGIGIEFPTQWVTGMLEWYWAPYLGNENIKPTNSPHYISPGVRLTTPVGFSMTLLANFGLGEDLDAKGMASLPADWKWGSSEADKAFGTRNRLFPSVGFALGLSFASALIPPDRDHDKIQDNKDKCPDEPEDYDGFEDEDGCPDVDNDKDGIPDTKDKCPNSPETVNSYQDDDGCPDEKPVVKVVVKRPKVKAVIILRNVTFPSNSWDIQQNAYQDLDEAIKTMKAYPKMRVEIAGHTDNLGGVTHNQILSQKRAESVRQYLLDKGGIEENRINAVGYGASQPIADNMTEYGRSQNRRIEFKVLNLSELDLQPDETDTSTDE
ncbi:MAG: OmpA family protein [Candidatus Coatesbacteria bacterium]|nr:OmpA family protein [Candidatus Coatesbacteria bacterium]